MRVRQCLCAVLLVALTYFVVACGNSSDAASPNGAGTGNGSSGNGPGAGAPSSGGAGNAAGEGSVGGNGPGGHPTGLVKLNLKVR